MIQAMPAASAALGQIDGARATVPPIRRAGLDIDPAGPVVYIASMIQQATGTIHSASDRVNALLIAGQTATPDVIATALRNDSTARIDLTTIHGLPAALQRLRDTAFDIVLAAHEVGALEKVESLSAIRTGSHARQAILVLGDLPAYELEAYCVECGADGYVCLQSTTVRALWCQVVRAIERQQLVQENDRLHYQLQHQRNHDRNEIDRILNAQRSLLGDQCDTVDDVLARQYQPILEAYVMMSGSGLEQEIVRLADDLVAAGHGSEGYLRLHTDVVHRMVGDLAGRGARHILQQSNLLAMDILLKLSRI